MIEINEKRMKYDLYISSLLLLGDKSCCSNDLATSDPEALSDDEIDCLIEEWHEADTTLPVYKYIGMTKEEYERWVAEGIFESLNRTKE
jgi:hypothetical protein